MAWKGRVRSVGGRERAVAGLVRSWEVGKLGRIVPDCFELFKTVGSDRGLKLVVWGRYEVFKGRLVVVR